MKASDASVNGLPSLRWSKVKTSKNTALVWVRTNVQYEPVTLQDFKSLRRQLQFITIFNAYIFLFLPKFSRILATLGYKPAQMTAVIIFSLSMRAGGREQRVKHKTLTPWTRAAGRWHWVFCFTWVYIRFWIFGVSTVYKSRSEKMLSKLPFHVMQHLESNGNKQN